MKANTDFRNLVKAYGLHLYQIADTIGVPKDQFYRFLRKELDLETKATLVYFVRRTRKTVPKKKLEALRLWNVKL